MAYLYRHIRLDKNEPFYIGVGKHDDNKFRRSRARYRRNKIWMSIVAKTKYEVEIMMTDLSMDEINKKEQEFIKLYGRICDGTGTLSNLSIGGEGVLGLYGALNGNFGRPDMKRRPVYQFDLKGRFVIQYHSITQAANEMRWEKTAIAKAIRKLQKTQTYKGYIWEYAEDISEEWIKKWIGKNLVQPFDNNLLPEEAYVAKKLNQKTRLRLNQQKIQF